MIIFVVVCGILLRMLGLYPGHGTAIDGIKNANES